MAVTRINNNQITDASAGNAYLGVNAAVKLQDYTVTSTKLANSLIYGSDLTITGNLTVQGNSTTIDTTVTTIEDPTILLASTQTTGSPTVDIGFVGARGNVSNIAFIWNEANSEFSTVFTSTGESNTTIAITSYANLHTNYANIEGNLSLGGNLSLAGNVSSNLNVTGTVTGGNLLTAGVVSATGNINGANVNATNVYSSGEISAIGNITANTGSYFIGNGSQLTGVAATTATALTNGTTNITTALNGNANVTIGGTSNVIVWATTGEYVTGLISATGNITGGNVSGTSLTGTTVSVTGNVTGGNLTTGGQVSASGDITGNNLYGSGEVSVTGNVTGANVTTSGLISATGNITGGNVSGTNLTGTTVSVTGNVTGGNVDTSGTVSATGNVTGGNVLTGGLISATGNITGGNLSAGSGNVDAGNVNTNSIAGANIFITDSGTLTLAAAGNVSLDNVNINNLADPTEPQDAATKYYVDSVAQGLDVKASVYVATTGNIGPYTYNNGTSGVGATLTAQNVGNLTIDGTVVSAGQRVLIKNEVGAYVDNTTESAAFNGIYVVTTAGSPSVAYVLTRATDFDNGSPSGEIPGAFTFVETGSTQADTGWVCTTNNPVTVGTTQIIWAQFSGAGQYTAGNGIAINGTVISAKVDNDTTAFDGGGNIIVKAGANLTTPNIGNATGNSLILSGNGLIEATTVSATGNVIGGNVTTSGLISATGNITGGNVSGTNLTGTDVSVTGTVTSASVVGGVITGTSVSVTGNVDSGNVLTSGLISATGNITGGNVSGTNLTGTDVSVTGTVTGGTISTTGNVIAGNVNFGSGVVSGTGNIYADTIFANISGNIDAAGSNTEVQFNTDNVLSASPGFTFNTVGNVLTANGNINGANFFTAGETSATGNVTGGNVLTGGVVSATGNINGNNVIATTIGQFGNVQIQGGDITSLDGKLTINAAGGDVDFGVNGVSTANILYIDAGTGTASFGSNVQTTNAIVAFNATTSVLMPTGNTLQRPGTGVTGMLRFNTSTDSLEVYDNTEWTTVGVPSFTVIADEQFNGDGSTVAFALTSEQTTNSCIVSINGVVQIPTTAYSVSGTGTSTLTFTEAPAEGDLIDVREITTTTTVTGLENGTTSVSLITNGPVNVTGNLNPSANVTYSLGNATNRWSNLYVGGNTIYLGNLQLKEASANTFAVYTADGVTEANIAVGNIDVTSIQSGTSSISIAAPNGNAVLNVAGTDRITATTTGAVVTGTISASGNITGSYIFGNGSQLTGIDATSIQNGTSSMSVIASGGNIRGNVGGATVTNIYASGLAVTGIVSATGNITGNYIIGNGSQLTGLPAGYANSDVASYLASGTVSTNIQTTAAISATGNVTGGNLLTGGLISSTGNITGGNISATNHTGTTVSVSGTITGASVVGGVMTGTSLSTSGNVTGGNVLTSGLISSTGNITAGNISATNHTGTTVSVSGNITAGNLSVSTGTVTVGNIVNSNGNGVGNIGSSTTYFNTVFAKATSAQYADLAEKYTADAEYEPGTVVSFGGDDEVTVSTVDADARVAGVISTNPSYIMNGGLTATYVATVALTGRVPCRVVGTVRKGDLMVSAGNGTARAEANPKVGTVIGKALKNWDGEPGVIGTIEVVVGRF